MLALKKLIIVAGLAAASLFATQTTASAQVYSPYYGSGFGYPYGYGWRNLSYQVTNPNGASVGYSITTAPGYYGGYGYGYGTYGSAAYPYAWPSPAFGPGAYSYNYPGVFYTPGNYTFFRTY